MNKKVLALVILILIIGVVAYFVFSKKNTAPPTSSEVQSSTDTQPATETSYTVDLSNDDFSPKNLSIKKGETVTWVNMSDKKATVDSDPHPAHTKYPPLNLGAFAPGEKLSLTFNEVGTFTYHDHFNPKHTGTIIVE